MAEQQKKLMESVVAGFVGSSINSRLVDGAITVDQAVEEGIQKLKEAFDRINALP